MKQLEYYLDLKNNFVVCYDPDVEFFCIYYKDENLWVRSKISFSQFCHDCDYKELTFEKAMSICNDSIPDELYYNYLEMLYDNGGIIKKRKINIIRTSNDDYKNVEVSLFVDGAEYQLINDNVSLMLDFKDHLIICKTNQSNIKCYELHVPYGIDDYTFTLLFQDNELIII